MVDKITLFLTNEHAEHAAALDFAKMRVPVALRIPLFRHLWGQVSPHALRKVAEQHNKITVTAAVLPECTGIFTTTMGLPCSHKIQERLLRGYG